jgi:hypothetical protein
MSHRFRALILLTVLVWQSVFMLGAWSVSQQFGNLQNLIVHSQDANHHHADNALHMDDDSGPVQHWHADSGSSSAALLTSPQPLLVGVRSMSPPDTTYAIWRSPTLEGLLRPPMSHVS